MIHHNDNNDDFVVDRFDEKYTRDLTATKKKLSDSEAKVQQMQQEIRKTVRERESAVAELLQLKSDIKKRTGSILGRSMSSGLAEMSENVAANESSRGNQKANAVYDEEKALLMRRTEELEVELLANEKLHKEVCHGDE